MQPSPGFRGVKIHLGRKLGQEISHVGPETARVPLSGACWGRGSRQGRSCPRCADLLAHRPRLPWRTAVACPALATRCPLEEPRPHASAGAAGSRDGWGPRPQASDLQGPAWGLDRGQAGTGLGGQQHGRVRGTVLRPPGAARLEAHRASQVRARKLSAKGWMVSLLRVQFCGPCAEAAVETPA